LFEELILPHEASLYGPAMALTRSSSDAEDLVQDTLLRAFDRFDTFRSDGSPRAWLHTIMRNLFFNAYRKKSREPKQVSLDQFDPAGAGSAGGAVVATLDSPNAQQPSFSSPERIVLSQMGALSNIKINNDTLEAITTSAFIASISSRDYNASSALLAGEVTASEINAYDGLVRKNSHRTKLAGSGCHDRISRSVLARPDSSW
jgi:RNA polymerase sigma factor (sigma-70 family)